MIRSLYHFGEYNTARLQEHGAAPRFSAGMPDQQKEQNNSFIYRGFVAPYQRYQPLYEQLYRDFYQRIPVPLQTPLPKPAQPKEVGLQGWERLAAHSQQVQGPPPQQGHLQEAHGPDRAEGPLAAIGQFVQNQNASTWMIHFMKIVVGTAFSGVMAATLSKNALWETTALNGVFNIGESVATQAIVESRQNPVTGWILNGFSRFSGNGKKPYNQLTQEEREKTYPLVSAAITVASSGVQSLFNYARGDDSRQAFLNRAPVEVSFKETREKIQAVLKNEAKAGNWQKRLSLMGGHIKKYWDNLPVFRVMSRHYWLTTLAMTLLGGVLGYLQGVAAQKAGQYSRRNQPQPSPVQPQTVYGSSSNPFFQTRGMDTSTQNVSSKAHSGSGVSLSNRSLLPQA